MKKKKCSSVVKLSNETASDFSLNQLYQKWYPAQFVLAASWLLFVAYLWHYMLFVVRKGSKTSSQAVGLCFGYAGVLLSCVLYSHVFKKWSLKMCCLCLLSINCTSGFALLFDLQSWHFFFYVEVSLSIHFPPPVTFPATQPIIFDSVNHFLAIYF